MSTTTGISWTDMTWGPLVGCTKVSSGCASCYAVREVHRLAHNGHSKIAADFAGLVERHANGHLDWTGTVRFLKDRLEQPLHWTKPRRIFVNSMSDFWHEDVKDPWIDQLFAVMALTPQHTYQILTKRAENMERYFAINQACLWERIDKASTFFGAYHANLDTPGRWPLPNVWLGVSVEHEAELRRIEYLCDIPAAVRFVSFEPLLEHLGNIQERLRLIDWAIIGGESGPKARPFRLDWAWSLIRQCQATGVSVWMKQVGSNAYDYHEYLHMDLNKYGVCAGCRDCRYPTRQRAGADPVEWPADLQVQEWPDGRHLAL